MKVCQRVHTVLLAAVFSLCLSASGLPPTAQEVGGPSRLLTLGVSANATHIAFAQGGVLWTVPRQGGEAQALVTAPEILDIAFPRYSPDGEWIAFTRDNHWNLDILVVAASGGEPVRRTYHPALDLVRGWSPQREILFSSNRDADGEWRLYTVPVNPQEGDFPQPLPLPVGYDGAFSPDGEDLLYVPISVRVEFTPYRFYRGGMNSRLWRADLVDSSVEELYDDGANHRNPIWREGEFCFTADWTGTFNLYCRPWSGGKARQLTHFDDFGIRHAAAAVSGDVIVFDQGGRIHLLDPSSGEITTVPVTLPADRPSQLGPREISAEENLRWAEGSPDGGRLAIETRGDVVILKPGTPVAGEEGTPPWTLSQRVTASSDGMERSPMWSPDGGRLAYFSDASGEYQLVIHDLSSGEARSLAIEEHPSFYYQPVWSPDGGKIAFTGERLGLWIADLESGRVQRVDRSDYLAQELYDPSWSMDSRYLAYSKGFPNHLRSIVVLDTEMGETQNISGPVHGVQPVFDRNGKYLHYLASNNAAPAAADNIWSLLSAEMAVPLVLYKVHTVLLHEGVAPPYLPFQREPNPAAEAATAMAAKPLDLSQLAERTVSLALPDRFYTDLEPGGAGEFFLRYHKFPEAPGGRGTIWTPLHRVRLAEAAGATEEVEENVDSFQITNGGKDVFFWNRKGFFHRRAELSEGGEPTLGPAASVNFSGVLMEVDPAAEYRQMFREAWRIMREFFYDPNHHGQDLEALAEHYGEYLPGILRRNDLNLLFNEMLGEVSISHMSIGGGDQVDPVAPRERNGTLGGEFAVEDGRYRVSRVYGAEPAYSLVSMARAAPLDQPGSKVREGEYLLALNGEPLTGDRNLYAQLEGTAWQAVKLTVGPHPDGRDSREVSIVPLSGDGSVERMDFFARNRRWVEEHGKGRVGYVSLRRFSATALAELFRQLTAQQGREAWILDTRFGPGGITADSLIPLLQAQPLHSYRFPNGEDLSVPPVQPSGPKVLLINEWNGSASETFPMMFQIAKMGTIVGKRTFGAGTGTAMAFPRLLDGGRIRVPNRASYDPTTGEWGENRGVVPNVEVEWWPQQWRAGEDPQLAKALEIALQQADAAPEVERKDPEFPVHPR